jgi:ACS family glucarate transporter-like MFS transporter/ACS family D-galactonate transporter-like MFS transporter
MAVGGALAPALTAQLLTTTTWQQTFFIYGIPGILWATLFFYFTSDAKETSPSTSSDNSKKIDWMVLITSTSMWLLCAQQFLRAAAMVFFSTWFPRFLEALPILKLVV